MRLRSGNIPRTSAEGVQDKKTPPRALRRSVNQGVTKSEKSQAKKRQRGPPDLDAEPASTRVKRQASERGPTAACLIPDVGQGSHTSHAPHTVSSEQYPGDNKASPLGRVAGPDTAGVGSSCRVSTSASSQQCQVNLEDPPQPSSFPIAARWVPPDEPPEEVRGTISLAVYNSIKEYLRDTTEFSEQGISNENLKQMGYDSWGHFIFLPTCINASGE